MWSRRWKKKGGTLIVGRTKGGWNTDNDTLPLQLLCEIDFVARRVLDQLDIGNGISDLDECRTSRVEKRRLGAECARHSSCEAACSKHYELRIVGLTSVWCVGPVG